MFFSYLNLGVQDIIKLLNVDFDPNLKLEFTYQLDDEDDDYDLQNGYIQDDDDINDDEENEEGDAGMFSTVITKIRKTFVKLRKSEKLMNCLKLLCDATGVKFIKPVLDVITRWDSTFDMLNAAQKLKLVFNMIWSQQSQIKKFQVNEDE